jgi:transcription-repair coupling factor (superfamily II helicase)
VTHRQETKGDFTRIQEAPFFRELVEKVASGQVHLSGLVEGSRALVLTLLAARLRKRILLVVRDDVAMSSWHRDLEALTDSDRSGILDFPAMDADPYDDISPHPEVVRERVIALNRICSGEVDIILAPARALTSILPSRAEWQKAVRTIKVGDEVPPDRFVLAMIGYGYKRVDTVSGQGEISRRGGIIDLFPSGAEEPVRIELFGDSIDSLRTFDPDHQRSTGEVRSLTFGPALECPPTDESLARVAEYLQDAAVAEEDGTSPSHIRRKLELLQSAGFFPGFESLAAIAAAHPTDLFDYIGPYLVVVDEPEGVEDELIRADYDNRRCFEESRNRILPPPERLYVQHGKILSHLSKSSLTLQELIGESPDNGAIDLTIATRTALSYAGRVQELAADLKTASVAGARTLCLMRSSGSVQRLKEVLAEYDIVPEEQSDGSGLQVAQGDLRNGFEFPEVGFSILTESEIFGEEKKTRIRKAKSRKAFLSDFRDLKEGNLVVHVDHGIATYAGLGRPAGGSLNRDFMVLVFAGGDRLFVPVDRLDLVQKYSGVAGKKPPVDRLGGPGWQRVKAKASKAVESMARQLLELYARRKSVQGHSFPADTPWQGEMEDSFPWELTTDQQRVVEEVKTDMESDRPMDRLLVGDVGFGKTEIAVRGAFKAVMDGKQVALLAPTTVLAHQHYKTFQQRYAAFPVKVELISRFRSAAEVRKVLEKVAAGEVDVLVGTHRLLSKDVEFQDLGLLVVDEEQRFGVAHKEKLKEMTIGVDVLAMTATPIPRTLQMSLAGVRDLSMIETPPPGRMAIQTRIIPWKTNVLAQAIRQEIRRDGQIFLVHNRIETLPALVRAVHEMVPEARVAMAHGQMREHRLEKVMMQFVSYEVDVLVTTTIIENGLDIPRANTIIVNRADRFGLAQL